jgi:hypothetical protein
MTAGPCSAAMDVGEQRNGAQRTDAPYLGKKEGPACAPALSSSELAFAQKPATASTASPDPDGSASFQRL